MVRVAGQHDPASEGSHNTAINIPLDSSSHRIQQKFFPYSMERKDANKVSMHTCGEIMTTEELLTGVLGSPT